VSSPGEQLFVPTPDELCIVPPHRSVLEELYIDRVLRPESSDVIDPWERETIDSRPLCVVGDLDDNLHREIYEIVMRRGGIHARDVLIEAADEIINGFMAREFPANLIFELSETESPVSPQEFSAAHPPRPSSNMIRGGHRDTFGHKVISSERLAMLRATISVGDIATAWVPGIGYSRPEGSTDSRREPHYSSHDTAADATVVHSKSGRVMLHDHRAEHRAPHRQYTKLHNARIFYRRDFVIDISQLTAEKVNDFLAGYYKDGYGLEYELAA